MLCAYIFLKVSSTKTTTKHAIPCFTLLQKGTLLTSTISPRGFINQCSMNYCSSSSSSRRLVEGIGSGYGVKSRKIKNDEKSHSFTVSYLINSCGLSVERAVFLSKKVNFESPEKPNAVLGFLKDQGFSKNHISKIVKSAPGILVYNPEKTLLPKIEFLRTIWGSRTELANNLAKNHHLLVYSLENYILPIFNCFKSVFLTDDRIANTAMWRAAFFSKDPVKNVASNVAVLRGLGVTESFIRLSLAHFAFAMMQDNDQFVEAISEVKELGFDPLKSTFMLALHCRSGKGNKSRWESCHEIYSSWGWSKEDIRMAYRVHPGCMIVSDQKLSRVMDFMINKMGWNSQIIARHPIIFCSSLEKRIIPRGSVIHFLSLIGLIKKENTSLRVFNISDKEFLGRFVAPYEERVPQLRDVYGGKLEAFLV